LLWFSKKKFGNVNIQIIYKTDSPQANSGVFVRIGSKPQTAWDAVHHGYEIQICDQGKDAYDDFHRTGAIYSFSKVKGHAEKPTGTWNTMVIQLRTNKITVYLNGVLVNQFDTSSQSLPKRQFQFEPQVGERSAKGYIGLQNHDPKSIVYYKSITVSPISPSS
jgi:hypothetical protein